VIESARRISRGDVTVVATYHELPAHDWEWRAPVALRQHHQHQHQHQQQQQQQQQHRSQAVHALSTRVRTGGSAAGGGGGCRHPQWLVRMRTEAACSAACNTFQANTVEAVSSPIRVAGRSHAHCHERTATTERRVQSARVVSWGHAVVSTRRLAAGRSEQKDAREERSVGCGWAGPETACGQGTARAV
jgi:hypothetical protein